VKLGSLLGMELGDILGRILGMELGPPWLGIALGDPLGMELGVRLGFILGLVLGIKLGSLLGMELGDGLAFGGKPVSTTYAEPVRVSSPSAPTTTILSSIAIDIPSWSLLARSAATNFPICVHSNAAVVVEMVARKRNAAPKFVAVVVPSLRSSEFAPTTMVDASFKMATDLPK
jgi:hypothetical protein